MATSWKKCVGAAHFQGGEPAILLAENCIFVPLDNSVMDQTGQMGHDAQYCIAGSGTEIIR
jgi:hypothetical protein